MASNDLADQHAAEVEAKVSAETGTPAESAHGLGSWAKARPVRAVATVCGGIALVAAAAVATWLAITVAWHRTPEKTVTIEQILGALDRRNLAEVRSLAKTMQAESPTSAEQPGGPAFALGAAAAYEAENSQGKDQQRLFLLAARYLEEANKRGFPLNRRAQGLYLLGRSLYGSGQLAASRPVLLSALKISPQYRREIHELLAEAYLNDPHPRLQQALEQNSMLLSDKDLPAPKLEQTLLQRARILSGMGKIEEYNATLERIPSGLKNPAVAVERGRALLGEARALLKTTTQDRANEAKAQDNLRKAIETLRLACTERPGAEQAAAQAMYLIGMCYLEMKDYRAASDQFVRAEHAYPETPEGFAAGLQAAELHRRAGRDVEALGAYRRVFAGAGDLDTYRNPWVSLDQLKSIAMAAYRQYVSDGKFEIALQMTRLMRSLFPAREAGILQAETHGLWGQAIISQAEKASREKAESLRRLGREQFRRAGACYAKLAGELPANRSYTDQVWNSAMAYFQGQDFKSAARMLQVYLKNEVKDRHPQALFYLGESFLADDQLDKALEMFKDCIDSHPRDVFACRARLSAAEVYQEKDDFRGAEHMLLSNLNGDYLTPESKEWRDSLFRLGELLHAQGRYAEAAERLAEAADRYSDLPESARARYLMAECYYKLAVAAQEKLDKDLTGNSGDILRPQIEELYSAALRQYRRVLETLGKGRDNAELTAEQTAVLRNCYFAVGDVLFAQGELAGAARAYSTAANRYLSHPEALSAYVRMAEAHQRLNNPQDAKDALQQAKFALERMKPDAPFDKTTNFDRRQWAQKLDAMLSL
jgi:TolA-binding protein